MRLVKPLALLLALALAACAMAQPGTPTPHRPDGLMIWPDLLERPRPAADRDRRLRRRPRCRSPTSGCPTAPGPHPIVLMVHGGCWQTEIADRRIMNWIADDLRRRGIAVWNIDYRGVDRPGGGYPGTFQDAAAAADALRAHAGEYRLDLSPPGRDRPQRRRPSRALAGGAAAAARRTRRCAPPDPIPIRAVISLGGLPDLEEAARSPKWLRQRGGRAGSTERPTSPTPPCPRLAPLGVPQVLINGLQDRIIPIAYAEGYARPMRAAGDDVRVRMIDRTGHVELVAPETAAWAAAVEEIQRALRR